MAERASGQRVAVTRPRRDSEAIAHELEARGHRCVIAPLLEIVPSDVGDVGLEGVQAILITSRNAVPALHRLAAPLPVFAVGDETARAAMGRHPGPVRSAGGDGSALAEVVRRALDPAAGALLHLAGEDVRAEPARSLESAGFDVRREVVYRAVPVNELPRELAGELRRRTLNSVLLFSPRTAATFRRLVLEARLDDTLDTVDALCMSQAVGRALGDLALRGRSIPAAPERRLLLGLLDGGR